MGGIREWAGSDSVDYPMVSDGCYKYNPSQKMPPNSGTTGKRFAGAFGQIGSTVYCVGGYTVSPSPGTVSNKNQAYDIATDTWTDGLAALPEPLSFAAAAGVGTSLYVLGGLTNTGTISNKVYRYDTVGDAWDDGTVETELPVERFSFIAAVVDNTIYVSGGLISTNTAATASYSDKVYAYDTVTRIWDETLPDLPQGRRCHSMVADGNMIYVLGGLYYDDVALQSVDLKDILALDTTAPGAWDETLSDMPMDLAGHIAAVADSGAGNKIYVLGGFSLDGMKYDVIEYDPVTDTARILYKNSRSAAIGWPRYWCFVGAFGTDIATIGGYGFGNPGALGTCQHSGKIHFNQVYVYDLTNTFDP